MGHFWLQKAKNSSNCSSLSKRCKFCGGEQESGDHESALGTQDRSTEK